MNVLSRIWEKLREKAYRDAFVASQLKRGLPTQIRVMLKDRGWNQSDLAERAGLKQGVISRAADPDYGNLTINTILKIASGFDVAYVGRFVPFSDLARWYTNLSERALSVSDFEKDAGFVDKKEVRSESATISGNFDKLPTGASAATFTIGQNIARGSVLMMLNAGSNPIGGQTVDMDSKTGGKVIAMQTGGIPQINPELRVAG